MNHKVILADDSLTIQKVIKITLANQPYDITDCSNEEELFHQLPIVQPKVVFLDFNLSDKYTGYELTTKIKSILPSTKVLLLLGTFDSVDDATMEKCGASDKIVKPFDSNKFIAICKQLVETFADDEEIAYPESPAPAEIISPNEDDQWTMGHPTAQNLPKIEDEPLDNSFPEIQNPLHKEMTDWGMSVPGVIGKETAASLMADLPPVISKSEPKVETPSELPKRFEPKFPENDDLDYPTIEEIKAARAEPKSQLISIESFNEIPLELETTYSVEETDVSSIEAQIRDEVEDNLWDADEFENLKQEITSKIEEARSDFRPGRNDFDDSLFSPTEEQDIAFEVTKDVEEIASASSIDRSEVEAMVKKYVKEYMDEMFKSQVEKISWEVIPDLAENLIRQELSKISNKIIND